MLEIGVRGEGEAFLAAPGGIELYEVTGNVLELALGALLDALPCVGADAVDLRRHAFLAAVLGELVEGVDGREEDVVVLIHELDDFLHLAVDVGAQQSGEAAHAVVEMDHIVAGLELAELAQRQGELARACAVALEGVLVEAVENLVVSEDAHLGIVVDESFVERAVDGLELYAVAAVGEYLAQAVELLGVVREYAQAVALGEKAR